MCRSLCRGFVVTLAAFAAACPAAEWEPLWQEHLGTPYGQAAHSYSADLDGDGYDELLLDFDISPSIGDVSVFGLDLFRVSSSGAGAESRFVFFGSLPGEIDVLRREGGDALAVWRPGPEGPGVEITLLSGMPLQQESTVLLSGSYSDWRIGVADVDADGELEVLRGEPAVGGGYEIVSRSLVSGAVEWRAATDQFLSPVNVLQLDPDPALELVVEGWPGRVLDGSLGLEEWSYAGGLSLTHAGELDASSPGRELVARQGEFAIVFATSPYRPAWDVAIGHDSLFGLVDLNTDGRDELIVSRFGSHLIVDGQSGVSQLVVPDTGPADLTGIGRFPLAQAVSLVRRRPPWSFSLPGVSEVMDPITGQTSASLAYARSTVHASTIADLDGDGVEEIVLADSGASAGAFWIEVRDLETGVLQRRVEPNTGDGSGFPESLILRTAQLDADPQAEIVVGELGGWSPAQVLALDSLTLEPQWNVTLQEPGGAWADRAHGLDVLSDGSGVQVLVLLDSGRVVSLAGDTGTQNWHTVPVPLLAPVDIRVAQADADAAHEILVTAAHTLYAFDAQTQLLDWSLTGTPNAGSFMVVDAASRPCRIAEVRRYPEPSIRQATCVERVFSSWRSLPAAVTWGVLDSRLGPNLLTATNGSLVLMNTAHGGMQTLDRVAAMGNALGARGVSLPEEQSQSPFGIAYASAGQVAFGILTGVGLFSDGFE